MSHWPWWRWAECCKKIIGWVQIWHINDHNLSMAIHVSIVFDNSRILFGKYNNKKLYRVQNFDTYYKTIRMYIFSCNMKSVQKLDFNSLSRIISGQFFVQKFMLWKKKLRIFRIWKRL